MLDDDVDAVVDGVDVMVVVSFVYVPCARQIALIVAGTLLAALPPHLSSEIRPPGCLSAATTVCKKLSASAAPREIATSVVSGRSKGRSARGNPELSAVIPPELIVMIISGTSNSLNPRHPLPLQDWSICW